MVTLHSFCMLKSLFSMWWPSKKVARLTIFCDTRTLRCCTAARHWPPAFEAAPWTLPICGSIWAGVVYHGKWPCLMGKLTINICKWPSSIVSQSVITRGYPVDHLSSLPVVNGLVSSPSINQPADGNLGHLWMLETCGHLLKSKNQSVMTWVAPNLRRNMRRIKYQAPLIEESNFDRQN